MISLFKKLFLVIVINYIDRNIFSLLSEYFLIFPLTFLAFIYYVYKSDKNVGAFESFSIGIFVDLISDTYFGLNAIIFSLTTYFINLNSKILVESAILFESNFHKILDYNILLISPKAQRISRVIKRDNINRSDIKKIMNVQWSDKKKISLATFVIENTNFSETSVQILSLISKIESLSEKK